MLTVVIYSPTRSILYIWFYLWWVNFALIEVKFTIFSFQLLYTEVLYTNMIIFNLRLSLFPWTWRKQLCPCCITYSSEQCFMLYQWMRLHTYIFKISVTKDHFISIVLQTTLFGITRMLIVNNIWHLTSFLFVGHYCILEILLSVIHTCMPICMNLSLYNALTSVKWIRILDMFIYPFNDEILNSKRKKPCDRTYQNENVKGHVF